MARADEPPAAFAGLDRPWRLEVDGTPERRKMLGMARMVQCVKLGREAEGLDKPPFKGDLGQKIYDNVSRDAWRMWLEHSKMLINEFRLDLTSQQGQHVWMTEVERYFFGEGSNVPPDFKPHE